MAQSPATETLMEEIRRFECVYNRQTKEYKEKFKKVNAWIAVSSKLKSKLQLNRIPVGS